MRKLQLGMLMILFTAGLLLTGCSALQEETGPAPDGGEKVRVVTTIFRPVISRGRSAGNMWR